jgi:hypothetical protein
MRFIPAVVAFLNISHEASGNCDLCPAPASQLHNACAASLEENKHQM